MTDSTYKPFPVVGIGASAGGVEALTGFFKGLPPDPGLAFVVVTHLSPDRESLLHEIIARYTKLPVLIACDGALVETNTVHVLPADAILSIKDRRLQIRRPGTLRRERKPIDIFFSTLAKDLGEYSAGVILSGGDSDGTLGIKAIKERGGLTIAQVADGSGPSHPDMPDSAISSGMVDLAIPAEEMGARLVEFAHGTAMLDRMPDTEKEDEGDRGLAAARREICALLRNRVGHNFEGYKPNTFMRRVHRRMQIKRIETLQDYIQHLRQEPQEVNALFRDLLINVTNFFRDADAFERLRELVIPKLFDGRGADDTVRVWIPGCATGEEVFTVAMLMREHMDTLPASPRVQIFATDIDDVALTAARAAKYPEALLECVSAERKKRFFVSDGGSYQVVKDVRDLCIFSPHSVLRDPPFSRIDLVSCRNLLIYFGPELQRQVIPTFHYSLKPGGYLFLGMSENASQFADLFTPIDKKSRIFRSRNDVAPTTGVPMLVRGFAGADARKPTPSSLTQVSGSAMRQIVDREVLEQYSPAHLVVNAEGEVLYYSARIGKYVEPPQGTPSRQLLSITRKPLRLDVRAAFKDVVATGRKVVRDRVVLETDDARAQLVTIVARPMPSAVHDEPMYLLLFLDQGMPVPREEAFAQQLPRTDEATIHLERELRDTRERLQAMIEEYETAVEELKSSNEELVSLNEELQSTNEELEASKEELQSLNEELHTVNSELSTKVDDLDHAKSDLENLFESTQVATLFLDRNLIIRSFTPAACTIFKIRPGDTGRPIGDFSSRLPLPKLTEDVETVLRTGESLERAIESEDGTSNYLARLAPYLNSNVKVDGVVLTIVDVTSLTKAESHQRVLVAELNHRVKNMLAVAIAIIEQTRIDGRSPEELKDTLLGRLRAMARSYGAIARDNWKTVDIGELINQELEPFDERRYSAEGPSIRLKPRLALSLGMILHELATNAAKHGAFSTEQGTIKVSWSLEGETFSLTWQESGGPNTSEPDHHGFGLKLIANEARYNPGGEVAFNFRPEGVTVHLRCDL